MTGHVAFLRGINVGGKNKIPMADLRQFASDLGLANPRTWLQSGNLLFEADKSSGLEEKLEAEATKRFGLKIDFMIKSAAEIADVIEANPYPEEAKSDPSHLLVIFTKGPVEKADVERLQKAIVGRETVLPGKNCVYIVFPDGIGESKLTNAVIERHIGGKGTARNWNTLLKIAAMF